MDIKLGEREIEFDLRKITVLEYEELFGPKIKRDREQELIAKTIGMDTAEIKQLSFYDYKLLAQAFIKKVIEPVSQIPDEKN